MNGPWEAYQTPAATPTPAAAPPATGAGPWSAYQTPTGGQQTPPAASQPQGGPSYEPPAWEQEMRRQGLSGEVGFIRGVAQTIAGVSGHVRDWTGTKPTRTEQRISQFADEPTGEGLGGLEESFGTAGETVLEFMLGDEALKGLSIADRLTKIAPALKVIETLPAPLKSALATGLRQGAVGGAQAYAKGEDAGTAATSGVVTGAIGGGLDIGVPWIYKKAAQIIKDLVPDTTTIAGETMPRFATQRPQAGSAQARAGKVPEDVAAAQQAAGVRGIRNVAQDATERSLTDLNTTREPLPADQEPKPFEFTFRNQHAGTAVELRPGAEEENAPRNPRPYPVPKPTGGYAQKVADEWNTSDAPLSQHEANGVLYQSKPFEDGSIQVRAFDPTSRRLLGEVALEPTGERAATTSSLKVPDSSRGVRIARGLYGELPEIANAYDLDSVQTEGGQTMTTENAGDMHRQMPKVGGERYAAMHEEPGRATRKTPIMRTVVREGTSGPDSVTIRGTSDAQLAVNRLQDFEDSDTFKQLPAAEQEEYQKVRSNLQNALDQYHAFESASPHFPQVDAAKIAGKVNNFGEAAEQLRAQAKPVFQRLDEVSGGRWTALREQREKALQVMRQPASMDAYDKAAATLDEVDAGIDSLFHLSPRDVNPGELKAANKLWADSKVLDRLHAAVESSYNGIPANIANRTGLDRYLKGGTLQSRLGKMMLKGQQPEMERVIGQTGIDNLYRFANLFNNKASLAESQNLLRETTRHLFRRVGKGALIGGMLGHFVGAPWVGAGAGALAEDGMRAVYRSIATNGPAGKLFAYAVEHQVPYKLAAPLIASALVGIGRPTEEEKQDQ